MVKSNIKSLIKHFWPLLQKKIKINKSRQLTEVIKKKKEEQSAAEVTELNVIIIYGRSFPLSIFFLSGGFLRLLFC